MTSIHTASSQVDQDSSKQNPSDPSLWVMRAAILWAHRRLLFRVGCIALPVALAIAFLIPKQYKSSARIMPPDQQGSNAMMLAALASRTGGLGSLGALAGGLLGGHTTSALFIDLLHSGTVGGHIIDRFDLQHVYGKRYRIDTAKRLAHLTTITDDKKSGVITIEVMDTEPVRARDIAQAYLDELNKLVTATNISAAHRERIFIEQRLSSVQRDLEDAQLKLGEFSSRNSTVDIKEQTRAIVDVGARIQGELLAQQASLDSLREVYGDGNIRVRQAEVRIATLQRQLKSMAGSSGPLPVATQGGSEASGESSMSELSPALRQLPRLAVPYADLYRRVKVQETVYELLTQQFEMARIEEAKDIPVVSVIDAPGIAEKKSFPPRLWITLGLTVFILAAAGVMVLMMDVWAAMHANNPVKVLGTEIFNVVRQYGSSISMLRRAAP